MKILFGTAGIPLQCKGASSAEGIKCVRQLGLDAMELEFVHGVKMSEAAARECGEAAARERVSLSAHAPYYVNLVSEEAAKRSAGFKHVAETCKALHYAGGGRAVFHAGFFQGRDAGKVFEEMREVFSQLTEFVEKETPSVVLAPEVTGKPSAFGSLDELLRLAKEFGLKRVNPCIDFGHLHARSNGGLKAKQDFQKVFEKVKGELGERGLQALHIHFTGIAFTEKGERNHLPIASNSPSPKFFAECLREFECGGTVISESPLIEEDALALKKLFERS